MFKPNKAKFNRNRDTKIVLPRVFGGSLGKAIFSNDYNKVRFNGSTTQGITKHGSN